MLESLYAGVFGGSAVALLFLLVDTMDGRPLYTPTLLGSVLFFGIDPKDVTVRLDAVALFSVLHITVFTLLGALISLVVRKVELQSRHPALLLLLLFAVIEATFFVVAPLAMPGVIQSLGIARVGVANLMAAAALTAFFVITHHSKTRGMFEHVTADFVFDTFYSAAVGGTTVAMFFFVLDIVDGHPFFTPALVGHVLFLGADAATVVNPKMTSAVIFIIPLHFAASLVMGYVVTWMVHAVELRSRHPVEVLLVMFVIVEVSFLLVVPLVTPGVIERVGIVRMLCANLMGAAAISCFFVWSHSEVPGSAVTSAPNESKEEETPIATIGV
ncbi:MAG TPA: hypothetical protein EYG46_15265 [Myxococcales bacterium]|nr:hypothetical protein [Myxococcales bacterium]